MGYPSGWSVRAGSPVEFMVSASTRSYRAEIIRITGRGPRPDGDGPPLSFESVPSEVTGSYTGIWHQTVSGSYGIAAGADPSPAGDGSVSAWVYPTLPVLGRWQSIVTWLAPDGRPGLALGINPAGQLALRYRRDGADGEICCATPLAARQWQFVAGSASPGTGQLALLHRESSRSTASPATVVTGQEELLASPLGRDAYVALLSRGPLYPEALTSVADGSYNGKIETPSALPVALDAAGLLRQADAAGGALTELQFVNSPARPATGHNWSGQALDWRVCPAEYQAAWYHDDDLADAGWPPAFSWQVPHDVRSGMYAARLTADGHEDVIPFYVRPAAGGRTSPLAVLIPTFTYTIYSNFHHPARAATASDGGTPDEIASAFLGEHRELGLSLYCKHRDGSGVAVRLLAPPDDRSAALASHRDEGKRWPGSSAATCTCWTGWSTRASSTTPSPTTTCTPRARTCCALRGHRDRRAPRVRERGDARRARQLCRRRRQPRLSRRERLLLGDDSRRRRAAPAGGAPRPQRIKDLDRRAGRGPPLRRRARRPLGRPGPRTAGTRRRRFLRAGRRSGRGLRPHARKP